MNSSTSLHGLIVLLAEQVVITVTDDDNVLKAALLFMLRRVRTGTAEAEIIEEAFFLRNDIKNVKIIDISAGKEERALILLDTTAGIDTLG